MAVGSAFSALAGEKWMATLVADCQPTQAGAGILKVKISDFPALQNAGGSVRLAINSFTSNGPTGSFYPVLVNRSSNDQFFALRSRCTHQGCVVPPYNAALQASQCPCHGSKFAIDGSVVAGPAALPLQRYTTSFDGAVVCIEIPGLGYSITRSSVQSGISSRIALTFSAARSTQYQVLFRPSMGDAGVIVPFATTASGQATATVFTGTGAAATLYVDQTSSAGFYTIAIKITQS